MRRLVRLVAACAAVFGTFSVGMTPLFAAVRRPAGREVNVATVKTFSNRGDLVGSFSTKLTAKAFAGAARPSLQDTVKQRARLAKEFREIISTFEHVKSLRYLKGDERRREQVTALVADLEAAAEIHEAFAAGNEGLAKRLIRALPIRIQRTSAAGDPDGAVRTRAYFRNVLKFDTTIPQLKQTPETPLTSGPSAGDNSTGVSRFECDVDPEDPCMTQSERDDVLTEMVYSQGIVDEANNVASEDYDECIYESYCSDRPTSAPAFEMPDGAPATSVPCPFGCFNQYASAFGSIIGASLAIAGTTTICLSPEPVSKIGFWPAYIGTVGAVSSAIGAIGNALDCHANARVMVPPDFQVRNMMDRKGMW